MRDLLGDPEYKGAGWVRFPLLTFDPAKLSRYSDGRFAVDGLADWQNAVHGGQPISKNGCSTSTKLRARARFSANAKFQGMPSNGSTWVRSSANPPRKFTLPASFVTRGGEKTSATCGHMGANLCNFGARAVFVCFLILLN